MAIIILALLLVGSVMLDIIGRRSDRAEIINLRSRVIELERAGGQAAGERDGLLQAVKLADLAGQLTAATKRAERAEATVERLQREAQECLARAQQPAPVLSMADLLRRTG